MKGILSMPEGLFELMDDLASMGEEVDKAAAEALRAGAETALELMNDKVPRDTGDLASTLKVGEITREGNRHLIEVGQMAGTPERETIKAIISEFGSGKREAHPFMRPAMTAGANKITKAMRKKLEERGLM